MTITKPRVLLVSGSFAPREGGAERQMREVLSTLADLGFSVGVLTQVLEGEPTSAEFCVGGKVRRVGSLTAFKLFPRLGQVLFIADALYSAIRLRPDIVISLQMGTASFVAAVAARILRRPHVMRLTGGGTSQHRSEPIARSAHLIGRLWCSVFDRNETTVVAPANHLLEDYDTAFPKCSSQRLRIPNGVRPISSERVIKDVLWYSRSGSEISTRIAMAIAEATPTLKYSIIGRIPDVPVPSNMDVLGWCADPERVIAQHKVILNTSANEGMPNTVLQALASGARAVGFANAGMNEIMLRFPERVTVVQIGDVQAAALVLREAVSLEPPGPANVETTADVAKTWTSLINMRLDGGTFDR